MVTLVSVIVHDLNNVLSLISMLLQLLKIKWDDERAR